MIVADGLAIADEPIELRRSEQATILVDTRPTRRRLRAACRFSLWQADLVGAVGRAPVCRAPARALRRQHFLLTRIQTRQGRPWTLMN